ncbi:HEPN domain-containing protein [Alitabrizicola rongguiensis]|uniref:HEPN domain-containing protein n=1 Tax=Alitabrizicola rongguiensis TaxID=2909234 RepID=UPI001F3B8343|nr:HEPN domain-containing protein [Tabrizicola rongguiensis]
MAVKVHRAISWIGRAQSEPDDPDAAFLFYWIAFNAAYADDQDADTPISERTRFASVLRQIVRLDTSATLQGAVAQRFQGPIRKLLENRYVFRPFWLNVNWGSDADCQRAFRSSAMEARQSMIDNDVARILMIVLDRLYVLRCQMVHGGTTWGSYVNRDQVRDGAAILGTFLPAMIDLMLDNPDEDWGRPFYPVVGNPRRGASGSAKLQAGTARTGP